MSYKFNNENPLRNLVELRTSVVDADEVGGLESRVEVELRVHPHEIEDKTGTWKVGLTEATLSLELVGLEILPKSKWGETLIRQTNRETAREVTSTESIDNSDTNKIHATAKGSALSTSLAIGASSGSSHRQTAALSVKDSQKLSSSHIPVRAIGNDDWAITTDGEVLDGLYLQYDPLCRLRPVWGGNRRAVILRLLAKQKHIKFDLDTASAMNIALRTINQRRILAIVATKSLHDETTSGAYSGVVCFAKSEASDEE